MKRLFSLVFIILSIAGSMLSGATYFVAVDGNDAATGSFEQPFKSLNKAVSVVTAGDYIYLRGGTYVVASTIVISTPDGTSGALIHVFAYENEVPILNYSSMAENSSNRGIVLDADYWHFKGVIIEQAGDNGMLLSGNNNKIEECIFRKNHDSGLQLSRYNTSYNTIATWPTNNLILKCESYDNSDSDHEDADGFAAKLTCGEGNIFRNCVSHHNIDDGWDLYTKTETGPIGKVTIEGCIAHNNGILTDGSTSGNGDKNGFKLGGEDIAVNHTVQRCIAFNNGKHGFTYNRNLGTIAFTNNTSFNNTERNFNFDGGTSVFTNNLSYLTGSGDRIIGTDNGKNAWDNDNAVYTVNATDFVSLVPGENNIPTALGFLNLADGSQFIDEGLIVEGILFNGTAPDLGAIETGGPMARSLEITLSGEGSVTPSGGIYPTGQEVTLTATPATDWQFSGWQGDTVSSENPLTLIMDTNYKITALFTTEKIQLITSINGEGSINVVPDKTLFNKGETVMLVATAANNSIFEGWSGDLSGNNDTLIFTIDTTTSLQANFISTQVNLTILTAGNGAGIVSVTPNKTLFTKGETLQLSAIADENSAFSGWAGDFTSSENPVSVVMDVNKEIYALFIAATINELTLQAEYACEFLANNSDTPIETEHSGYHGVGYVDLENAVDANIRFSVYSDTNQSASITIRYAHGATNDRSMSCYVNDTEAISSISFPTTGAWTSWSTQNITVNLSAGANSIEFVSLTSNGGPNLDEFIISANNISSVGCSTIILPLNTPTSLTAEAIADGKASLSWSDNSDNETGFILERKSQFGNYTILANLLANTETYTDTGLIAGSTYKYRIKAYNSSQESNYSNEADIMGIGSGRVFELSTSVTGSGTIILNPAGSVYPEGTLVTLTAYSFEGHDFTGWSGDITSTDVSILITMDTNISVTAYFTEHVVKEYSVTITALPSEGGTITLDPAGGTYEEGTTVKISANSNDGFVFSSWSGDLSDENASIEITVDKNISLVANFDPILNIDKTLAKTNDLLIYPNPAQNSISIATDNTGNNLIKLELYNSYGQLVQYNTYFYPANSPISIDISNIANGIYFIKIIGTKHELSGKFIKE